MAQFHPFPGLPKELRDQIWDMAIRDDDPAVHSFVIFSTEKDPESVVDPAKQVHAARSPRDAWYFVGFAAPRCRASGQLSWTDGNISTYLTDSGLWTACFESRDRMLRHFRPSETSPQAQPMPLDLRAIRKISAKPTASVNMGFIRENGEHQILTIRPSADLIIFQLPENSSISWDTISSDLWEDINDFPSFRWHTTGNAWEWDSSEIKNVAVEYNPEWAKSDPETGYGPFDRVTCRFSFVTEICGLEAFWIIDYSLKRKYKHNNRERQKFRAGRLTFIHVDSVDDEWCCCPKKGPHSLESCEQGPGGGTKDSAHTLAGYLHDSIESLHKDIWVALGSYVYLGPKIGVLACVDLESEGELPTMEEWYEMNA